MDLVFEVHGKTWWQKPLPAVPKTQSGVHAATSMLRTSRRRFLLWRYPSHCISTSPD